MRPLTDQERALLTADSVTYTAGLDLLDTSNNLVADISDDLVNGSISWDNRDAVKASCRLSITRELAWGRDRVRPWMVVDDGTSSARFDFPPFVLTAPDTKYGEDPITFEATGYDLLSLLQSTGPADTYEVTAGTTYLQAARNVLTASGIGAQLLVDGTLQDTPLPATMVWALTDPAPSWLRILTDLFAPINYVAPYPGPTGAIHSHPAPDPATKPVDWELNTDDERTNIVGEGFTLSVEAGDIANWWRVVRSNWDDADGTPTEGNGIYTPTPNQSDGPTSIDALGRQVRKFVRVEAADQAALVAQGERIKAEDMASVRTWNLEIDPLPAMGFGDTFQFTHDGATQKVDAASWSVNLDGSPGQLQLGGAPAAPLDKVESQSKATITSAAPLRVAVDGATVDSFANALDAATYQIGQRVTVTVRNPSPPLIQGSESS